MANRPGSLLTATWRDLAVLTYEADPGALRKRLLRGLSLDLWQGRCLVSLVGLRFLNTRVMGIPLPIFGSYPEVNLRFYVRRDAGPEQRRGVVFIRQLVPYRFTAWAARLLYHEQFAAMKLTHSAVTHPVETHPVETGGVQGSLERVEYGWRDRRSRGSMAVWDLAPPVLPQPDSPDSIEAFVTQRHWGYGSQPDGCTLEYRVSRPTWPVCRAGQWELESAGDPVFGEEFVAALAGYPVCALYAQGSAATIHRGIKLL